MKHFIKHAHSSMSRYSFPLILFFLFLSFAACQDDDERAIKNPGILSLALAADTTFGNSAVATKASVADEFIGFTNPNEYAVEILQGEEVVLSYARFGDMPDEIELAPGSYTMRAYRGNNYPGRFSNPYFEGKTDFKIEKGMRTPIRDTATLANTRVFVNYTDDFIDAYEEFRVRMNTEYMQTDTLNFREDETRAGYFRSDAEGTELILSLWLVKREDTIINYYKPEPLTIFPRENIRLLFKTDGEALNGIGLEVTVNNELDGEKTLNMTIPEYAWGDVKEPTLYPNYFEDITEPQPTYFALQNGNYVRYLDYAIPGSVGKCIVSVSKSVNGGDAIIAQYDLANANDAAAARELGITLGDRNNDKVYTVATEAKEGRIHFTEALAKLPASTDEVEYIYSVYIVDALPTNPNSTETVQMIVAPKVVGPSTLVGTGVSDYTILATAVLPNDIVIKYDTDAGIQSSTLTIKRNGDIVGTPFNILSDALPTGIYYSDGELKLASSFVRNLEVQPLTDEEYTFTIDAVDNLGRQFSEAPMSFSVKLEYVFEIVVPAEHTWGWKATIEANVSGISSVYEANLEMFISEDNSSFTKVTNVSFEKNKLVGFCNNLTSGITYYVKVQNPAKTLIETFVTEGQQINNSNFELTSTSNKTCTYRVRNGLANYSDVTVLVPDVTIPSWSTNNSETSGVAIVASTGWNADEYATLGCFPTVVEDIRNGSDKYIIIRSIDAGTIINGRKNGKARGELDFNGAFEARPSSISFDYAYTSYTGSEEKSFVKVVVFSGDLEIASSIYYGEDASDFISVNIPINYSHTDKKATRLEVLFASSDSEDPATDSGAVLTAYNGNGLTTYTTVKSGSTLKIDNVMLNYTGQ